MNQDIRISYADGRFLVKCPMWANDALNGLVSKRWSKAKGYWTVPAIRKNVEAIKALSHVAFMTDEAKAGLAEHEDRLKNLKVLNHGFPSWYKYKTPPLKGFQSKGLDLSYNNESFAFFMDRGTGKSWMAVNESAALRMEDKISAVLVIVKKSLRKNWVGFDIGELPGQREGYIGHCPIPCSFHLPNGGDEAATKKYAKWLNQDHEFPILIMGMESLSQGGASKIMKSFLQAHAKVMVIIDEAQDIANHDSIRSKLAHEIGNLATYKRVLTGSPISTGPMNLFSYFEFLGPNIIGMGDYYAFRGRYAVMGGFPNPKTGKPTQIVGYQNLDELFNTIAPYVYQVRKSEVLSHLPPKVYERRSIQLSKEQKALYKQIKSSKKYEHDGSDIEIKNTLELALRLHTVCGGYITSTSLVNVGSEDDPKVKKQSKHDRIVPSDKNPKMMELLDIIEQNPGASIIVWAAYRWEVADIVREVSAAVGRDKVVEMHGAISDDGREDAKRRFQSKEATVLVGNPRVGGAGHTLTACEIMVYWNNTEFMIDREQSEDRAHRHGLDHSVLYIDLIAEGSVDELIMKSIEAKMDLAEYIRVNIDKHSTLLGEAQSD